ncbi:MAG: hypothetical protein KatS3mg108_0547 [Isosphaeraceae bacterium]|nr:MAG: hypothetical protein KatS3mg108_0547 [Isosphaeraceae bacterium]
MSPRRRRLIGLALLLLIPHTAHARQNLPDETLDLPAIAWQAAHSAAAPLVRWYQTTPPIERVAWGGLAACALLATLTFLERLARTHPSRIIPRHYADRFHARLLDGRLDWHQATDHCEINPSAASRLALAALRRAGRPGPDIERGIALALAAESAALRRHLPTLRRVAALSPLIGLLGSLGMIQHGLQNLPPAAPWGPTVAHALLPLIAAVGLAILALVAYDGLTARVESLLATLERFAAEIVDHLSAGPRLSARPANQHPAHPAPAPHPGPVSHRPPRDG